MFSPLSLIGTFLSNFNQGFLGQDAIDSDSLCVFSSAKLDVLLNTAADAGHTIKLVIGRERILLKLVSIVDFRGKGKG